MTTTTPYWEDADASLAIYLGDMREILPALQLQADLIVADPPYEETSHTWDRWPTGWLNSVAAIAPSMWCFGGLRMFMRYAPEFAAASWHLSHDTVGKDDTADVEAIWEKHNASGPNNDRFRRIHEQAGHFYQGRWRDVYRQPQRITTGVVERGRVVKQGAKDIGHRVGEAVDTAVTLGWALAVWIVLLALAAALAVHAVVVAVAVPVGVACRAVAGALAASRALRALGEQPGRYRPPQRPSWAAA